MEVQTFQTVGNVGIKVLNFVNFTFRDSKSVCFIRKFVIQCIRNRYTQYILQRFVWNFTGDKKNFAYPRIRYIRVRTKQVLL